MDFLAPLGPVYQAGTLSGNPLAMAAGIASLSLLKDAPPYAHLEKIGTQLAEGIRGLAKEFGFPIQVPQTGSMFCLFFSGTRKQLRTSNGLRTRSLLIVSSATYLMRAFISLRPPTRPVSSPQPMEMRK